MSGPLKTLDVVRVKLVLDRKLYSEELLNNSRAVYEVMKTELIDYDREAFCILNMKTNGQCINMNIASMGGLNYAYVEPREVFKSAILSNANHIILVHNHPSGSVAPTKDDILLTQRLVECGKMLGIKVCDHVIIGGITGEMYSFQDHGLMEGMERTTIEHQEKEQVAENKENRKQR